MKYLIVALQVFNAVFAFTTSEAQTKRIMDNVKKQNVINASIMIIGGIIAAGGTVLIFKNIKKGTKQITNKVVENNGLLLQLSKNK
jgi:hypothetical protein